MSATHPARPTRRIRSMFAQMGFGDRPRSPRTGRPTHPGWMDLRTATELEAIADWRRRTRH